MAYQHLLTVLAQTFLYGAAPCFSPHIPSCPVPAVPGGLFLRLRRAFVLPLVAGKRNISVFRKMALFLPHGVLAKRNGIDRLQKLRGQQRIHALCQIPPPQIVQIMDVGLKYEIVDVVRKLLKLLRRHLDVGYIQRIFKLRALQRIHVDVSCEHIGNLGDIHIAEVFFSCTGTSACQHHHFGRLSGGDIHSGANEVITGDTAKGSYEHH